MNRLLQGADAGLREALGRLTRLRVRVWLAVCVLTLTGLFWSAASGASVSIDGVRYHYLDDDQMISMRYARNLAEGHGLVWNPGGERVEGYTNFGWTLVMAGVHALGAGDATAAWWVRGVNWLIACVVLVLAARLMEALGVGHGIAVGAALLALTLSYDLLFWSINGFETTLLTAAFLWALLRALRDAETGTLTAGTCLLAGLLPLIRADAVDLTAAVLVVAVALGARRGLWAASLAVAPLLAHVGFRIAYYGDVLPNTYYLKVAGREHLARNGLGSVKEFLATYPVAVVLAAAAAVQPEDKRGRLVGVLLVFGCARMLAVGPDIFGGSRFLAPYVPVLLAAAVVGVERVAAGSSRAVFAMAVALAVATVFSAGVNGRATFRQLVSRNGVPIPNTVAGVLINRHALPGTRVVVSAAGCLPYFSRREAIDLLGKSDRRVARLPDLSGEPTGHSRYDIDWSLRNRPDLIAPIGSASDFQAAQPGVAASRRDYSAALAGNPVLLQEYDVARLPLPPGIRRGDFHVHEGSPEGRRFATWRQPEVER